MADITYTRGYSHSDWIDNQDVVQAGGEKGFNQEFHSLEAELDKISTTFGAANTAIQNIQRLNFLSAQPPTTLAATTASPEFDVETYDRTPLPPNVEKAYFVIIFPASGSTTLHYTLLYRTLPGNMIKVTVQFFNLGAVPATFSFRLMTLATQS